METWKSGLALELFEFGAIRVDQEFSLALHSKDPSKALSPFYINLRDAVRDPLMRAKIGKAYLSKIEAEKLEYHFLADLPDSISPLVAWMSNRISVPQITPRNQFKERGTKDKILGKRNKGMRVLLIDDVITDGTAKLPAISLLRQDGLMVHDCLILVERTEGGRQNLAKISVNLHAVFQAKELLSFYYEQGLIEKATWLAICTYCQW